MNGNRKIKKMMALTMSGVLTAGLGMSGACASEPAIEKEETVYVRTSAAGVEQDIIVSDWLKNKEGAATITDAAALQDIENVKGDETFSQDGTTLTWEANGNDIFYQGKTDKELPVSVKITYFLDGKEMLPEEIAGKSGHVKIKYEYTNHVKNGDIYTPFLLVTGMLLDEEIFSNVTVDHGKVVNDGNRSIVVGYGLPGFEESLDLDALRDMQEEETLGLDLDPGLDIHIPNSFEIEADAVDFSTNIAMTMAMPLDLSKLDLTDVKDWDDMQDKINELKDNVSKLVDGTSDLADGVQELKDGCEDLLEGMTKLDDGADDLNSGAIELDDGMGQLNDGIQTMNREKRALVKGVKELSDGLNQLDSKKMTLANGVARIAAGANELNKGAGDLKNGMGQLYNGIGDLDKNRPQLVSGVRQLVAGINQIEKNKGALTGGAAAISASLNEIDSNLKLLLAGSQQVSTGIKKVNETLPGNLDQMIGGLGQLADGIDASLKSGELDSSLGTLVTYMEQYAEQLTQFAAALSSSEDGTTPGYFESADQVYAGIISVDQKLGEMIELLQGMLETAPAISTYALEEDDMTAASGSAADVDYSAAISSLESSIAGDQAVLNSLLDVKSQKSNVPEEMISKFSGAYGAYSAQLDSCISQMQADIASEQQALAVLQAAANAPAPAGVMLQSEPEEGISAEDLQMLLQYMTGLKEATSALSDAANKLQTADTQLKPAASQIANAGTQLAAGINAAKTQITTNLTTISSTVKAVKNGLTQMKDSLYGESGAMKQLESGSAQVTSGISQISDGVSTQLLPGFSTLQTGIDTLFVSGIDIIADGLNQLGEKMPALDTGITALKAGAAQLYSGTKDLKAGTTQLAGGSAQLNAGTGELVDGIGQLAAGGNELNTGVGTLSDGVKELADGSRKLKKGTGDLVEGTATLKDGTSELKDGGTKLDDGVQELLDGSVELRDGVAEFDEKGVQKITDFLETDLKEFIDRLEDVRDASATYHLFSEESDDENCSVKFIIETDGI